MFSKCNLQAKWQLLVVNCCCDQGVLKLRAKMCPSFPLLSSLLLCLLTVTNGSTLSNQAVVRLWKELEQNEVAGKLRNTTECHVRLLAYEYAIQLQPRRAPMLDVFASLRLHEDCLLPIPSHGDFKLNSKAKHWNDAEDYSKEGELLSDGSTVFVDYSNGDDTNSNLNPGALISPVRTVSFALNLTRYFQKNSTKRIVLRGGVHYLSETIELNSRDNGLVIENYPGEEVWISGGVVLKDLSWKPYEHSFPKENSTSNIWVTKLNWKHANDFEALHQISPHKRMIRARFPNSKDPEDRSTVRKTKPLFWHAPKKILNRADADIVINYTDKTDSTLWQYNLYANGRCKHAGDTNCPCGAWEDVRSDGSRVSESYWCSQSIAGGWSEMDQGNGYYNGPVLPEGLTYNVSEGSLMSRARYWKNATGATIVGWRAQGWFVNMFKVHSHDKKTGSLKWDRWSGGWQGGRGWQVNSSTGDIDPTPPFYIEGILEELDVENEWYYDPNSDDLYVYYPWSENAGGLGLGPGLGLSKQGNAFGPAKWQTESRILSKQSNASYPSKRNKVKRKPKSEGEFVIPRLFELIRITGNGSSTSRTYEGLNQWVQNITIKGIGFRDTRPTFLAKKWGVPSGGDWALSRTASLFIQGTVNVTVKDCRFRRVNGNGMLLSGFNRQSLIEGNEFTYIGDTAIATWGFTKENSGESGLQPRGVTIRGNFAHDVGVYQLQSSMYFQAKSCLNKVYGNIFFDGPRSGINFNDGFGGGTSVYNNLIFNLCKQSGDHGPINSWDRQIFVSDVNQKHPYQPLLNDIHHNFIIANYGGSQGVDNDDGSSYYNISHNVFYGEGLKQDYGGHDSFYTNNLNIVHKYDGQNCINTWPFRKGHGHLFAHNKCILNFETEKYGKLSGCDPVDPNGKSYHQIMRNNSYFTTTGFAKLECGGKIIDLAFIQNHSYGLNKFEEGSTVNFLPNNSVIDNWIRDMLQLYL